MALRPHPAHAAATLGAARPEGVALSDLCRRWGVVLFVLFAAAALRSTHAAAVAAVWWANVVLLGALLTVHTTGLRSMIERGAERIALDLAATVPAPSDRPALRADELAALAFMAACCAAATRAARDRTRAIGTRVMAACAACTVMIQPRLATTLVARHAAASAA